MSPTRRMEEKFPSPERERKGRKAKRKTRCIFTLGYEILRASFSRGTLELSPATTSFPFLFSRKLHFRKMVLYYLWLCSATKKVTTYISGPREKNHDLTEIINNECNFRDLIQLLINVKKLFYSYENKCLKNYFGYLNSNLLVRMKVIIKNL